MPLQSRAWSHAFQEIRLYQVFLLLCIQGNCHWSFLFMYPSAVLMTLNSMLYYICYDYDCLLTGVFWMPLKFPTFNFLFHLASDIITLEQFGLSSRSFAVLKLVLRPYGEKIVFIKLLPTNRSICFLWYLIPVQCTIVFYQWEFAAALFQF